VSIHRFGGLALALASLALALSVAELGLRLFPRTRPSQGLRGLHQVRPDRPWLFGLRPGAEGRLEISGDVLYRVNEDGFRDRLYTRSKPMGTFRVLVLGDSLTFGYGVAEEETYPKVMESELGGGVEFLNFGVNGYNPYTEAALFDDVGVGYDPDLVLAQFCINDLNDPTLHFDAQTLLHLGAIPDAAYPDPAARRTRLSPRQTSALRLCRRLRLCSRIDDALLRRRAPATQGERLKSLVSRGEFPPGPERPWLRAQYEKIARRAASIGAEFAVLAFPQRGQVGGEVSGLLQAQVVALGSEGGWATVDLLPALRSATARGSEPLFLDAWHLSAAGHRVVASAVISELERRGLLPPVGAE
jgi:lysophospholipase L1-like esterase